MSTTGIFWFTNDLRLHDQRALIEASQNIEALACVYILDPRYNLIYDSTSYKPASSEYTTRIKMGRQVNTQRNSWGINEDNFFGRAKQRFLYESLTSLEKSLSQLNQELLILLGPAEQSIATLSKKINATKIFRSNHAGYYENNIWRQLQEDSSTIHSDNKKIPLIEFVTIDTHTLFRQSEINSILKNFPISFSKFKKIAEQYSIEKPIKKIDWLPMPPANLPPSIALGLSELSKDTALQRQTEKGGISSVRGSEAAGLKHLKDYFSQTFASTYKETRNELDGWENSTKLSPWLANGALSPKKILSVLHQYEISIIKNNSTYWILFELLWREYFQWYAHNFGHKLFSHKGIKSSKPLTSFYSERYQRWCSGSTQYPLVNALMKQLNACGYMSNRGRQIVASCFVHELQLDWRYGATYFERQLVDYDVASNWGNWQYLAGVGADPRGHRRFDIAKQTQQYDPNHLFIKKWAGSEPLHANDSVDAADWPLSY